MITTSREQRRQLARDNAKLPAELTIVPTSSWPERVPPGMVEVWRSRDYLVQVYAERNDVMRLSISRTRLDGERWEDGIAWEDLQRLKRECGYGHLDAVEVFPDDCDVVNVANMRHLWVMPEHLGFAWRRAK